MNPRLLWAIAAVAICAPATIAQETVTFRVEYAQPVLAPGQVQTILVWASMAPGINQPAVWNTLGGLGQVGTVWAYAEGRFNLVNVQNGQTGVMTEAFVSPSMVAPWSNAGVPSGGGVTGIVASQSPVFFPGANRANPILLWTCTWMPTGYEPRTVTFDTFSTMLPTVSLADILGGGTFVDDAWQAVSIPGSFQVVPAPSALSALALAALIGMRRGLRTSRLPGRWRGECDGLDGVYDGPVRPVAPQSAPTAIERGGHAMSCSVQPIIASLALLIGGSTRAQETVTFTIEYSSAVLTPGQSQNIEVWALMEPGIGQPAVWNTLGGSGLMGEVLGFSAAWFNFVNVNHGQSGTFSNLALNSFLVNPPATSAGTPDGNGHVTGIFGFQWLGPTGGGTVANPILLWSAVWTPANYDPRLVEFTTVQTIPPHIWLLVGLGEVEDQWAPITIPNSFQVVPAPSALSALALAALIGMRRGRTSTPAR